MTDPVGDTNHIENNEEANQNEEVVKRPRGRPRKDNPPQEPRKIGRPSKNKPPKRNTTSWKTMHICRRNDIKTQRS